MLINRLPGRFGSGRAAIAASTEGLIRLVGMTLPGNAVRSALATAMEGSKIAVVGSSSEKFPVRSSAVGTVIAPSFSGNFWRRA